MAVAVIIAAMVREAALLLIENIEYPIIEYPIIEYQVIEYQVEKEARKPWL
jgi:hypothetical protein